MSNQSFSVVRYVVTFRRSKTDPQERKEFSTSEAAYHFAIEVESSGGITMVQPTNVVPMPAPKLKFED